MKLAPFALRTLRQAKALTDDELRALGRAWLEINSKPETTQAIEDFLKVWRDHWQQQQDPALGSHTYAEIVDRTSTLVRRRFGKGPWPDKAECRAIAISIQAVILLDYLRPFGPILTPEATLLTGPWHKVQGL